MKSTGQQIAMETRNTNVAGIQAWQAAAAALLVIAAGAADAGVLRSYSEMPNDRVTFFPSPFLDDVALAGFGVSLARWINSDPLSGIDGHWAPGESPPAATFFSDSSRSSAVAPFGRSVAHGGLRLTFSVPIYWFVATELAIDPDMPGTSSLPLNLGNTRYELRAYGLDGDLIEAIYWSSYGQIFGPVEYYVTATSRTGYMASYAGLWSDNPIHEVTILGARPRDSQLISATGSVSFSFTPRPSSMPIPEPTTLSLLGLGLAGLGFSRRRTS